MLAAHLGEPVRFRWSRPVMELGSPTPRPSRTWAPTSGAPGPSTRRARSASRPPGRSSRPSSASSPGPGSWPRARSLGLRALAARGAGRGRRHGVPRRRHRPIARAAGPTLGVPPSAMAAWAAVAPPRGGWERVGALPGDVHAGARAGSPRWRPVRERAPQPGSSATACGRARPGGGGCTPTSGATRCRRAGARGRRVRGLRPRLRPRRHGGAAVEPLDPAHRARRSRARALTAQDDRAAALLAEVQVRPGRRSSPGGGDGEHDLLPLAWTTPATTTHPPAKPSRSCR